MIWIGILFVLLLAANFSLLSKKDISFTLPLSGFTLTLLAYILSWTGLFPYFRDIINSMILLFSAYTVSVFFRSKDKKSRLNAVFSPGLIGYLILCIIVLRFSCGHFCQWDEFSHWGTVVKDMFFSKRLGIYPDSVSSYKTYPPGAALWELYFVSYYKEWNDWPVIFAYNLLLIQWMMPIFGLLKFRNKSEHKLHSAMKNCLLMAAFVIIIYLMPYLYNSPFEGITWRCIYIDRALAFGFSWLLFMHFGTDTDQKDPFYYFAFSLGAAFQCLLKGTGGLFLLMALVLIISDVLLTSGKTKRNVLTGYGTACILPLLTILSWYAGLRMKNVSAIWDMQALNMNSVIRLISGQEESWRYRTIRNFLTFLQRITLQFYHGSIVLTITAYPLVWAAGTGLISALNGKRVPETDKRNALIALTAFFEFIIYELVVLLIELYVLTPDEAMKISSGQRYSADYTLGMSCFIIFYIISYLFSGPNPERRNFISFALLLLFIFSSVSIEKSVKDLIDPVNEAIDSYRYTNFSRYEGIEEKVGNILKSGDNCYILSEDDAFGHFVLRKQFIPVRTNSETISSETEDKCETFLKEILFNRYDHVFVNKVSDEFNDNCKGLFEDHIISELTLYSVNLQNDFKLIPEASFN